jgi:hypothetical protein
LYCEDIATAQLLAHYLLHSSTVLQARFEKELTGFHPAKAIDSPIVYLIEFFVTIV